MKLLKIESCVECPVVVKTCGNKLYCGHNKVLSKRPYAPDRKIGSTFPEFCPFESVEFSPLEKIAENVK